MRLNDGQRQTLVNALRAAAWVYESDASTAGPGRIADQFLRQAAEAEALAQKIEQGELVS